MRSNPSEHEAVRPSEREPNKSSLRVPLDLELVLRATAGRLEAAGLAPKRLGGVSTDSRTTRAGDLFIALRGPRFDAHDHVADAALRGATACVVERPLPGLSIPAVVVGDTLEALERIAMAHLHELRASVTAITGSVGKTTTKELLKVIFAERFKTSAAPASFNNRIGVALTILGAAHGTEHIVVELGTSAPGEISHLSRTVRPQRAIITDIAPAHLTGLRDLDGVVAAKAEIFDGLASGGTAWVRSGIVGFERFRARAGNRLRTFGWGLAGGAEADLAVTACECVIAASGSGVRAGYRMSIDREELFLPVLGRHNVLNAAAAIAVARDCGIAWDDVRRGLSHAALPPRRLELVSARGALIVDDSYNANPRSLEGALETFAELRRVAPGRGVVVLGDMLELGAEAAHYHEEAGRWLAASNLDLLVCLGEHAELVVRAFRAALLDGDRSIPEAFSCVTADEAYSILDRRIRSGDRVLVKGSNASGAGRVGSSLRSSEAVSPSPPQEVPGAHVTPSRGAEVWS